MATNVINVPPFPPLRWDDFFWIGEVVLPSWAGFQSRRGPYGALSAPNACDGSARLNVASMNQDSQAPPNPEEARAFGFLMQNESLVSRAVLEAVVAAYPKMCDSYGYDEEEAARVMPLVKHPNPFRQLIGLSNGHVLNVANAGLSYVGFEFGCTWDPEHGLGVMTHRDRLVDIGGADSSFLEWIADRDVESGAGSPQARRSWLRRLFRWK